MIAEDDIIDDEITQEDWDSVFATHSPLSSKRSQSFGVGSLPSPQEPKRPRYDTPELDYISLPSDDDDPVVPGEPPAEAEPVEMTVDRLMAEYAHAASVEAIVDRLMLEYTHAEPTEAVASRLVAEDTQAEPVEKTVDRLVALYKQGVPLTISEKKAKYYVVWRGRNCGIFLTWEDCRAQVNQFPNCAYKSEKTFHGAVSRLTEKLLDEPPEELVKLFCKELLKKPREELIEQLHRKLLSKPREDLLEKLREKLLEKFREQARVRHHSRPSQRPSAPLGISAPNIAAATNSTGHDSQPIPQPEYVLCEEQQEAMDLAVQGHNLFITGSGGCGKSILVKALYRKFRNMGRVVYLVSPTGLAAVNIGGRTIFSYAGWTATDSKKSLENLRKMSHRTKVFKRFMNTDVLIIDEISMVDAQCFERLSDVICHIRQQSKHGEVAWKAHKPFGGVQIIAVGDFCQLPPVKPFEHCTRCGSAMQKNVSEKKVSGRRLPGGADVSYSCLNGHGDFNDHNKWAFKSPEWDKCKFKYVHLTKIHRQQEGNFISVLQKCRLGKHLEKTEVDLLLNNRKVTNGVQLYSRRDKVNCYNERKLEELSSVARRYRCLDSKDEPLEYVSDEDDSFRFRERYPQEVVLKLHMPVILLANIDLRSQLCNGSQGIICDFVPRSHVPRPTEPQERNYKNDPEGFKIAMERYKRTVEYMEVPKSPDEFPKVRFHNGLSCVIGPECIVNEVGLGAPYALVSRAQIPLVPGWAMTIHKSQSLSLDRVIVSLADVFEKGQAYVALSRARSLSGLKVKDASENELRRAIKLDLAVEEFMKRLEAGKSLSAQAGMPS